jgi:hypothetical protein
MSAIARGRARYERPFFWRLRVVVVVISGVGLLAVAAFLLGRGMASAAPASDPIRYAGEIPVGVDHSPAGALAAADDYVAIAYDSVERNPGRDAALIGTVYAPSIRASATSGAAAVRAQDASSMSLWAHGGQNLCLIGARRLDFYRGDAAQVSSWDVDVFWGPGRAPKQGWVLTQTSLRWGGGRWLVTATTTLPTAGPVPALTPQAAGSNDSPAAFDAILAGYTAPSYGAAG